MNRYSYKAEGYQGLGYIARLKGEYKKALEYLDKDLAYTGFCEKYYSDRNSTQNKLIIQLPIKRKRKQPIERYG